MRRARTHLALGLLAAATVAVPVVAHAATKPAAPAKPVALRDPESDVSGAPDINRVQLGRAKDGRLRAVISLADDLDPADLVAKTGPPGSVCLRVWTLTKPGTVPPDFLVCASATANGKQLRASVATEQVDAQPKRVADAGVSRDNPHTVVLRFSRSSVSGGKTIRRVLFAAEATRPGCTRVSCTDTAPDAPKTLTLTL